MDADYEVSAELAGEIGGLEDTRAAGYGAAFVYRMHGHALRASLYPPRIVLYRRETMRYRNEGHGHRVTVAGPVAKLAAPIYHDDRKPLARWLASQQRYARDEADHLLSSTPSSLRRVDRLRRMGWPAPFLVLGYTLLWEAVPARRLARLALCGAAHARGSHYRARNRRSQSLRPRCRLNGRARHAPGSTEWHAC